MAAKGVDGLKSLLGVIAESRERARLPEALSQALQALAAQLQSLSDQIGVLERNILAQYRASEASRRLQTIPSIGVIGATAITATVTDASAFKSGREFAAWVGLVPRQSPPAASRSSAASRSKATGT